MTEAGGPVDEQHAAVLALQRLLRLPTVSDPDEDRIDQSVFDRALQALQEEFPLLYARAELIRVGVHGQLLHLAGRSAERPVVLMAHLDVVPVDHEDGWTHPPFGGVIADGAIWGRGSLDDKGQLVAICAAVENLLGQGWEPEQDLWLSFGAREEVSGPDAALAVAELSARGVWPWFVLDEGGAIAGDAFPTVNRPLAVIGVSEKGTTTFRLRARGHGGHASTPATGGPTVRIARAVSRLDRHQFPPRLPAATIDMFGRLAPHADTRIRPLLRQAQRFAPVLARLLSLAGPEAAALVRTTTAVTMLQGSPAHNVIAGSAEAVVNLRLLPGDTVASADRRLRRVIADPGVEVELIEANEPSPVSMIDEVFDVTARTAAGCFPEAVVTPYVMLAATDARFFSAISTHVYRFAPFRMSKQQRQTIHSDDEHLQVDDFLAGIEFYRQLIKAVR